jgi:hypothetical protein
MVPLDLIAGGTSASTDATAALDDGVVVALELEDELLLLLPHAAIAPTHSTDTGTASQLLFVTIANAPFPEDGASICERTQARQNC